MGDNFIDVDFSYSGDPAYADIVTAVRVRLPFQDGLWLGEDDVPEAAQRIDFELDYDMSGIADPLFLFPDGVIGRSNMSAVGEYLGRSSGSPIFRTNEAGTIEHFVGSFAMADYFHVADGPDYVEVTDLLINVERVVDGFAGAFTVPVFYVYGDAPFADTRIDTRVTGGMEDDTLLGGAGDDVVKGLGGEDALRGRAGEDRLSGGAGNDMLAGNADDDLLFGQRGRDVLRGGAGVDDLSGGRGDDVLSGGGGDDLLFGGRGDDRLRGGGGADVFATGRREGRDVIRDFEDGVDMIRIRTGSDGMGDLKIVQKGDHAVVRHGGPDDVVVVRGIDARMLDGGDFMFG